MTHKQQSSASRTRTLTLGVPSPKVAQPTKAIAVVRAESELLAIDELMAELTIDFVAEVNR
ncbi:MAG: hypothetical protein ABI614_18555 [Planctomycetota bacterium]